MWNNYEETLTTWIDLRNEAKELPLEEALHKIHDWVQTVPTTPHYLHLSEYEKWPLPWELLADNCFCEVAKALLIVYTVILSEQSDIKNIAILQDDNYTYVQIKAENTYILNDQIGSITSDLSGVSILHVLDCEYFKNKLI